MAENASSSENESTTEYVEVVPNFGAMFTMYHREIMQDTTRLITDIKRTREPQERVAERLRLLNGLMYNVAMALNCTTSIAQITALRETLNASLATVNENSRRAQEQADGDAG